MSSPRRVADFLLHIQEAIDRIREYTGDLDEAGFAGNRLVQDAVIRNIEIIGEACNKIRKHDPEFANAHADIPWGFAVGMRVLALGVISTGDSRPSGTTCVKA